MYVVSDVLLRVRWVHYRLSDQPVALATPLLKANRPRDRLGPGWTSGTNFKFQMFSNDILSDIIVIKAVTEKTVRNLNLNFKFLSDGNFRWWAFRNYAYFVMKPSGCDTVRLRVWPLHLRWFEIFSHVVALEILKFEFWVKKSIQEDSAWPCGQFAVLFVYYNAI